MGAHLRFAIVGSGMIGRLHAAVLGRVEGATLTTVADVDPERAAWLAERSGARVAAVEEALTAPDVDAVVVCAPSGLHGELGAIAAASGKHVLVEKPIDVSIAAADRLISTCDRNGVALGVISQHRFDDSAIAVKRAVEDGRLGRPIFATSQVRWWRDQAYYDNGGWKGTVALDGGALLNQGVHHVDLLLWLLGPAARVYARCATAAHRMECEDLALATLDFAGGALGTIEVTTAAYPGFPERLSVTGANGTVAIEGIDIAAWGLRDTAEVPAPTGESAPVAAADPASLGSESHRRQVADFVDAIRSGRRPAVTGEDGRRALQLILAARESNRTGQPVELAAAVPA